MESLNSNLYSNIRQRMSGVSSEFQHNEDNESDLVRKLKAYKDESYDNYIKSLLNPESHISKVPSPIPVESAIAKLRYNFAITPNASGKFLLVIDPFYGSGYLYQDATVNGTGTGSVTTLTFAQDATIIDQWRLVSSSLIMKYYGNFSNLAGVFVAANTSNVTAASTTSFLTFANIEALTSKQVIKCIDGVKMIYSPVDDNATEFNTATAYSDGTHPCRWQYLFVVYGDLFPNTASIRCDYFRNIEYQSTAAYKQYIPQTKDNPKPVSIPNLPTTIGIAPKSFATPGMAGNESSFGSTIMNTFSNTAKTFADSALSYVGNELKALNPYALNNYMTKSGFGFGMLK